MRAQTVMLLVILLVSPCFAASDPAEKANKLYSEARYSEALPLYQSLLSSKNAGISPGDIYTRIGDCYFRQAGYERAASAYRSALQNEQASRRPATQYWIGFCLLLLGRDADATAEFLKIPAQYPSSGMWVNTAYYWAGRASERMGKKEVAADYYKKAGGRGKSVQERFAMKKADAVKGK